MNGIDEEKVREMAEIVKRLGYNPISFDNPDLFPEPDEFIYPNYVFFMVAIDHRTGFDDVMFKYHGSDLLFYLARKKLDEEPEFFTAKRLIKVTAEELKRAFTFRGKTVDGVGERAYLLRDCARRLIDKYAGDFMNLLRVSEFDAGKILPKLSEFRAYEDPLRKKSMLLLKILKRQGYVAGTIEFPVDSVLVRIAISSGIVIVNPGIMAKIKAGEILDEREVKELRKLTQKALLMVAKDAGIEPDVLDDLLWTYGREMDSKNIETALDERVDREALQKFIEFLRRQKIGKIRFPRSWYF